MVTDNDRVIWPDIAIPPGELLAETIEAKNLSQSELARRMDRPIQVINEIIKGKRSITPETAIQLERVLGTPAYVWINLEKNYEYNKARLVDLKELEKQIPWLDSFPYRCMAELGWVRSTGDKVERVKELLSFFGVTSFEELKCFWEVAYRRSYAKRPSPEALAAWLRRGEIEAHGIDVAGFDEKKLKEALAAFRELTRKPAREFSLVLRSLCASCGIALVFIPHLPKTYAHGATRWLAPDKALVQLSVRYRYDDIFWFSFFHEAGHIIRHGKKRVFVEINESNKSDEEMEADRFARDTLIPPDEFRLFTSCGRMFSKAAVVEFACRIEVAPSIVVGRLQHEGLIPHTHLNALRTQFTIK
ncbi:HigA family addiction module antidote protein [Candidatus Poribacteria bacterium]|nr:HigA family addiction module antidote protein [Candidatus Poribacteria bacterium]